MSRTIEIKQVIYSENEAQAQAINRMLTGKKIFTVNVLGGAGAGKTSTLINLVRALKGIDCSVIEGDLESDIDTQTLRNLGVDAYQINTGGQCHLNAPMIESIAKEMKLREESILFIENIGNLVCPAEFVIGEHIKILVCSVPEGSDKPYKYPIVFRGASAIVLTKTDLAPYLNFDRDYFMKGVRALNKEAPVFEVCNGTGEGFDAVIEWLRSVREQTLHLKYPLQA